eukprot:15366706-Ditylum_brightwellii.AAC.1
MAVAIKGIYSTVLKQEIAVAEEEVLIKYYPLCKCPMIESMERTNKTEKVGSMFYMQENKCNSSDDISRTKATTNSKAARAVGSYKDVLQGYGNPQEEVVVDNSTEFNHNLNPICSRKHPAINLDAVSQVTTTTYASQVSTQTPINVITQEQPTQQLATS